jgi:epidermal growth factor receptor substrate 15
MADSAKTKIQKKRLSKNEVMKPIINKQDFNQKSDKEIINELKNQQKEDKKQIELLKKTVNNLLSSNKRKSNPTNINIEQFTNVDQMIQIKQIQEENQKLKNEMKNLQSQIKSLQINLTQITDINKEKDEEVKYLSQQLENLKNVENENIELKNQIKSVSEYTQMIKDLSLENESLKDLFNKAKIENSEYQPKIDKLEKQVLELRNLKYDDKLLEYEKIIENDNRKIGQQNFEIEKLVNEVNNLKTNNENLQLNSNIQMKETDELKAIIDNLRSDLKTQEKSIEILEKEKAQYILENTNLNSKFEKMENENSNDKDNLKKYNDEIKNLNDKINLLQNEKNNNEIYFLNEIQILTKERNTLETQLNKFIVEKHSKIPSSKYEDIENKYDIALSQIKSYRNDNKKLFDLSKLQKEEILKIHQEIEYYQDIIQRIIKYHVSNDDIKNIIYSLIDIYNNRKKLILNQRILNDKISKYNNFITDMNSKTIEDRYNIISKNNYYSGKDFFELSNFQNELISINQQLFNLNEEERKLYNQLSQIETSI